MFEDFNEILLILRNPRTIWKAECWQLSLGYSLFAESYWL